MSVQNEHDIRSGLADLLGGVTPHPAPVASAIRQGAAIRMRRRISAAAVLAVIAAGAAITPVLLHPRAASPVSKAAHYTVAMYPLGTTAAHGVIAAGVTNGKRWKIIMSGPYRGPDYQVSGPAGVGSFVSAPVPVGQPVGTSNSTTKGFTSVVGTVSPNVASVTVRLPDHTLLRLRPVTWNRRRWIGLVLPSDVPIVRAVAYSRHGRELAYSIPFGNSEFVVWWHPGDAGPAQVSKTIGTGWVNDVRWKMTAQFGPWGYCYTFPSGSFCSDSMVSPEVLRPGQLISPLECGTLFGTKSGPIIGIAAVARGVGTVALTFSGGRTESFPSVTVGGGRSLGYAIPAHQRVTGSTAYSPAGQIVGSPSGARWNCGS